MNRLAFLFSVFGRVRRRDFLLFLLVLAGISAASFLVHPVRHDRYLSDWMQVWLGTDWGFIVFSVVQLATACVVIKRCHDRDLSGLWALALLVPIIGWAWLGYELCVKDGTDGPNRFGPSPKSGYKILY